MTTQLQPLKMDLILHAVFFLLQIGCLIPGGLAQSGTTPPLIYTGLLVLATITVFRQNESLKTYESRLILVPSILSIVLYGLCLINEMGRDLWGFSGPRQFPVLMRVVWYQSGLLSIHPLVFPTVWNVTEKSVRALARRGYFGRKLIVTCLIIGAGLWFLRSQNISPDGYDWLKHSVFPKNWVRYLREPLGTLLLRLTVVTGQKLFHWDPYIGFTMLGIGCCFVTTWLMSRVIRFTVPSGYDGIVLALLLASMGYMQIFIGNIEIYVLLHTGLAFWLYAVVRYLKGEWPVWGAGIAFAILFCAHLSAGWWLPCFMVLPFLKKVYDDRSDSLWRDVAFQWFVFASLVVSFWLFVLQYGYLGDYRALWDHFWSDEVMYVGTDFAMFRKAATFLSFDYYRIMLNEYFYMMPGVMILILALAGARFQWERGDWWFRWLLGVAGFYFVYTVVWNPDRHFPGDWDLFSGLTIPAVLVIGSVMSRLRLPEKATFYIMYQAMVFSALYLFLQLLRNHIKVTEWPLFL